MVTNMNYLVMILYIVHNLQKNEYRNIISVLFKRNKYCINLRKEKIMNIDFTPASFLANSITLYSSDFVNYSEIFSIDF